MYLLDLRQKFLSPASKTLARERSTAALAAAGWELLMCVSWFAATAAEHPSEKGAARGLWRRGGEASAYATGSAAARAGMHHNVSESTVPTRNLGLVQI